MHKELLLAFCVSAAALLSSCQSTQSIAQKDSVSQRTAKAFIGKGVELSLPSVPSYPGQLDVVQTLIARHDGDTQALQAVLTANQDHLNVVLMLANGPRVIEIDWSAADVLETRSSFAPEELSGLNILADIFLVFWPIDALEKALPPNVFVEQSDGLRVLYNEERQISEIRYFTKDKNGRDHYLMTNFDLGYSLTIYSDATTPK